MFPKLKYEGNGPILLFEVSRERVYMYFETFAADGTIHLLPVATSIKMPEYLINPSKKEVRIIHGIAHLCELHKEDKTYKAFAKKYGFKE